RAVLDAGAGVEQLESRMESGMSTEFDYKTLFRKGLQPAMPRFGGLPKYPFIGGHNDPELLPSKALADAAARGIEREGSRLAIYNAGHGFQGYEPLRDILADKMNKTRGTNITRAEIMITSGSAHAIDLIDQLFIERGDTVIMEELSFHGALGQA